MSSSNPTNESSLSKQAGSNSSMILVPITQRRNRGRKQKQVAPASKRLGIGWLIPLRKKVLPVLMQSPAEEANAELLKAGPLETPTGTLRVARIKPAPFSFQGQRSVDNETRLAPIEEQSLEESTAESSSSAGNGRGGLFCGCFDLSS